MAETLFISDLHLSANEPATVELFRRFLAERAPQADALYILGDLFDAWLGDDNQFPPIPEILSWIKSLPDQGTAVSVMHGNRDFLLGERFAELTNCRLIEDPTVIDLCGTPTLLMHGDTLCTDDVAYQRFRAQIRNPGFIQDFLSKPLPERLAIAAEMRRKSGEATAMKAEDIMDVNAQAVVQAVRKHGVRQLIHGHTHRPGIHEFEVDGKSAIRYVLADWHPGAASVLVASENGLTLESFPSL